jgi:pimeloyl-ACP methyl ester carboxylesterase
MEKYLKIIVIIIIVIIVLGFLGNIFYVNLMHSMVSNVKKVNKKDNNIKQITIDNKNDTLVGYVRSTDFNQKKKTIIYLPGSGEISYNAVYEHGNEFNDYVFASVDYPGAQESTGRMNKESILNSGLELYDYLIKQDYIDVNNIYIMGWSYSTGIMSYLASNRPCKKMVLVAPYRDSADMYNKYSPIYYGPMKTFITENFETKKYAENISIETLIITSNGDKTMNMKYAYDLKNVFKKAQLKEYNNISHTDYFKSQNIVEDIRAFLQ